MDKKVEKILQRYKGKKIGVFIDDANMFHSQKRAGWSVDWKRFRDFLGENFNIKFIKYYRGIYSRNEKISKKIIENHRRYGQILRRRGFEIIHRNLKKIYVDKKYLNKRLEELNKNFLVVCFEYNAPWEFFRLTHIFFEEIEEEVRLIKNTPRRG